MNEKNSDLGTIPYFYFVVAIIRVSTYNCVWNLLMGFNL
jgi:hypothetical protein